MIADDAPLRLRRVDPDRLVEQPAVHGPAIYSCSYFGRLLLMQQINSEISP
jgi:hypothetical protein